MKFESPNYLLFFLGLIPYLVFMIFKLIQSERQIQKFFSADAFQEFFPKYSRRMVFIKFGCYFLALSFGILSLANPFSKESLFSVPQPVRDVMVGLDVSLSMNAEDVYPSRFDAARNELDRILKYPNIRVSLFLFSGNTLLTLPLTQDREVVSLFIKEIKPGYIQTEGTDYIVFFQKILYEFDHMKELNKELGWENFEIPTHLIMLTDGDGLTWPDDSLLAEVKKRNILLWIESFGSESGAEVPLYDDKGVFAEYLSMRGEKYFSKIQEERLQQWVSATGGYYLRYSTTQRLSEKVFQISETKNIDSVFQDYLAIKDSLFPLMLIFAILFLMLAVVIG